MLYIGIDPGTKTGFAVWDNEKFKLLEVQTLSIIAAFEKVKYYFNEFECILIIEDARKRKWFGKNSFQKLQGAGSIKRDCNIWEEFITLNNFKTQFVHPIKGATKVNNKFFKDITGYKSSTTEHSRDAAMLVYNKR